MLFCWRKHSNVLLKFEPELSCLSDCLSVLGLMGSSTGMDAALFLGHNHKSSFYFLRQEVCPFWSYLAGPSLAHKVSFVSGHYSTDGAHIFPQSTSCLNLCYNALAYCIW